MNQVLKEYIFTAGRRLQLVQGDITTEEVDAIVNAANRNLKHGGGVAGAIVRKGGQVIQDESDTWTQRHGPVSHSDPAYTSAGALPARYVIHAVGPVLGEGDEDQKLAQAVRGILHLAAELELTSLALPAISTGIFGFPKDRAARIILDAIQSFFSLQPDTHLNLVRLTLFDQPTVDVFLRIFELWAEEQD